MQDMQAAMREIDDAVASTARAADAASKPADPP
jgi:hypothetical protein